MKKIVYFVVLLLLVNQASATSWKSAYKNGTYKDLYINGCVGNGASVKHCTCLASKVESKYPILEDYMTALNNGRYSLFLKGAAKECISN